MGILTDTSVTGLPDFMLANQAVISSDASRNSDGIQGTPWLLLSRWRHRIDTFFASIVPGLSAVGMSGSQYCHLMRLRDLQDLALRHGSSEFGVLSSSQSVTGRCLPRLRCDKAVL